MPTMIERIERRCRDFGGEPVLIDTGTPVPGGEFWARARALGDGLQDLGVTAGSRVALSLPPSGDLYVAVVATWLAGAAFVPLDPAEAPDRRERILADSQAAILLTAAGGALVNCGVPVAHLAAGRLQYAQGGAGHRVTRHNAGHDEAYVIFTSGSTGRPKGVSVSHAAIATYIVEVLRMYEAPDGGMAFPLQLPPTFDAALTSMLPPLLTRNVAVPILDETSATRGLGRFLVATQQPVLVKTTPSQLTLLRDFLDPCDIADLRAAVVVGGEPLSFDQIAWIRGIRGVRIYNEYGPTEATVGCSVYRVTANDPDAGPVPIGTPHGGAVFTVDPDGDAVDGALSGELVIAGPCLANGYVNDFGGGFIEVAAQRQYRTGDWVRRDGAGVFHFLGRRDDQVKINGVRVELGEAEQGLRAAAGGRPAAVVATDTALLGAVAATSVLDVAAIKADLRRLLPAHMRPSELYRVPGIPLTAQGKIDRAGLRELLATPANAEPDPSDGLDADPIADAVQRAWRSLLGPDDLDEDADFFAVGDSITALRLVGRVAGELGHEVPVSLIFDHRTLRKFTEAIRGRFAGPAAVSEGKGGGVQARTVAPSQTAILDAERWAPRDGLYTVVAAVTFDGVADQLALEAAINETLSRHDVFTWQFERGGDDSVAAVAGPPAPSAMHPEVVDLRALPADRAEAHVAARLANERQQPVPILGEPHGTHPRAIVFRLRHDGTPGESGVCALVAHHAVIDELSVDLLWREIFARAAGLGAPDGHDRRYADWAEQTANPTACQRALLSADEIADRLCAAPLGALAPPVGAARGTPPTSPLRFVVPMDLSARCVAAAATHAVPVSAVYGAAAVRALGTMTSEPRFAVFMPMTLRRRDADFDAVGCFVASVPVLAENAPSGEPVATAISRWHREVGFAAQRADADQPHLTQRLRAAAPTWFADARVSLAFEQGSAGRIGPVTWLARAATPAAAKHDLSIYLTAGTLDRTGAGRIVWREGSRGGTRMAAVAAHLVDRFRQELQAMCDGGVLPAAARERAGPPLTGSGAEPDTRPSRQPEPTAHRVTQADVAQEFAKLAADLLDEDVGLATDLFEAGARSLDLMQLAAEITRRHGVTLRPVDVFDCPTPASLAALVMSRRAATRSEGADR